MYLHGISTAEMRPALEVLLGLKSRVLNAPEQVIGDGVIIASEMNDAAASETLLFAGCLIPSDTSQAGRKKPGPPQQLDPTP